MTTVPCGGTRWHTMIQGNDDSLAYLCSGPEEDFQVREALGEQ